MGVFSKGTSTSFNSGYVFYQDLANTYPKLYRSIKTSINRNLVGKKNVKYQQQRIISNLSILLRSERQKELNCLRTGFGVSINVSEANLLSSNLNMEIMTAFNTLLQTKEMFRRHKDRINHRNKKGEFSHQAKIGFANVFQEQLLEVLNRRIKNWVKEIRDLIKQNPNTPIENIVKSIITDSEVDSAIIEALDIARVSGDWQKSDRDKGLQGYLQILTEILNQIRTMPNHPLMNSIKEAYGFNKLTSKITDAINVEKEGDKKNTKKDKRSWVRKGLTYTGSSKGSVAEAFAAATVNALKELHGSNGDIQWNVNAAQTGQSGIKADVIIGVNIDVHNITDMFTGINMEDVRKGESVRQKNLEQFNAINQKLENWDADQFIIYVNAKEYSLIRTPMANGYVFSGFSTGSPISLSVLQSLGIPNELIGAIINTLNGAIGEGMQEHLNNVIAEYMAHFLFDDFDVIGTKQGGAQSIHMMLLDGIYMPMSVCYSLLLESFKSMAVETVFKAEISDGDILYPETPEGGWQPEMWDQQKTTAMSTMTVTAKLMANFIEIMQQFS